ASGIGKGLLPHPANPSTLTKSITSGAKSRMKWSFHTVLSRCSTAPASAMNLRSYASAAPPSGRPSFAMRAKISRALYPKLIAEEGIDRTSDAGSDLYEVGERGAFGHVRAEGAPLPSTSAARAPRVARAEVVERVERGGSAREGEID